MLINYNVTGAKRKKLVNAISRELNAPVKYLGAPAFAYQVGDYIIDKNGVLKGKDNPRLIETLQDLHDFKPVSEEYELPEYEISETRLTIEMPRSIFTDSAVENLKRLVASKESLIKKALGTEELPIEVLDDTIRFPWFADVTDAETVKVYTHFITALCEMAKSRHRVNMVKRPVENEKYAFRCFLLRLGFIGLEYKIVRKILLSKLTGSSAFKNLSVGGAGDE
jgi:hypothetical protein